MFHGLRSTTCFAVHGALSGSKGRDLPAGSQTPMKRQGSCDL
jgi:hypothetical protein